MWQQRDTPIEGRVVCGVVVRGLLKPFPKREEGKSGRWRRKFEDTRRENSLRMAMCMHCHLFTSTRTSVCACYH